ncbi:hypothetical protein [Streptomyces flavofungini]|uniref:hypothetical protein n=1 Tax=Streptomyces flavofungini TaxID=68200 RepID=UPI0025B08EA1|nr:hypothetical protein [Streptomyces flavofungini]WJV46670.1 hypothetical protein QUY26_14750 [Streptomyces flavofungini]
MGAAPPPGGGAGRPAAPGAAGVPAPRAPRLVRTPRAPRPPGARRATRPRPPAAPPEPSAPTGGPAELVNSVVGAASFAGALMLYAGYIYTNAYFGHFHLDTFAVGFDTFELVVRSLGLAALPALEVLVLTLLIPYLPRILTALRVPAHQVRRLREAGRAVARAHAVLIAAGAALLLLWRWIQPYAWAAPLLVAVGLLLGHTRAATTAGAAPPPPWRRTASLLAAGLFLIWVVALVAGERGRHDARHDADHLVRRVAVVVLSTDRLSFAPPGPAVEDLGRGTHYRYRYSGLRLLIERDQRYYLLPLDWQKTTDPTYVIKDDDDIRIELRPGTQPRLG